MPPLNNTYDDVATLEHNGVKARITKRKSNLGVFQYSYQFYRSYCLPGGGAEKDTLWLSPRHMVAVQELVPMIAEKIQADQERA
jgi:hypothetical protein